MIFFGLVEAIFVDDLAKRYHTSEVLADGVAKRVNVESNRRGWAALLRFEVQDDSDGSVGGDGVDRLYIQDLFLPGQ